MKKFLLISLGLLLLAILLVILVFLYISVQLNQSQSQTVGNTINHTPSSEVTGTSSTETTSPKAIPLRDLQLNQSQQSALDTVGIDVDTFVITPEIQTCAAAKLGNNRMSEIIAGDVPTMIETTKLISCL